MRRRLAMCAVALLGAALPANATADPVARIAATCSDYPNQAAAQRAADTRDSDGDGIYCESLPCPCLKPGAPTTPPRTRGCTKPTRVTSISFSKTKYPNIRRHFLAAVRKGWPRTLVLNRPGASARRDRLLRDIPTKPGYDRDEYPPAVGRGKGPGLMRGVHPVGWMADVRYVPSAENRSHGGPTSSVRTRSSPARRLTLRR